MSDTTQSMPSRSPSPVLAEHDTMLQCLDWISSSLRNCSPPPLAVSGYPTRASVQRPWARRQHMVGRGEGETWRKSADDIAPFKSCLFASTSSDAPANFCTQARGGPPPDCQRGEGGEERQQRTPLPAATCAARHDSPPVAARLLNQSPTPTRPSPQNSCANRPAATLARPHPTRST